VSLTTYYQLLSKTESYWEENEAELLSETHEVKKGLIETQLRLFRMGCVWCRNEQVCRTATWCQNLDCPYKTRPADVVAGCCKCQQFAVSRNKSGDWSSAIILWTPDDLDVRHAIVVKETNDAGNRETA
jgi:hypothetical protein